MLATMPLETAPDREQLHELARLARVDVDVDVAKARVARRARTILLAANGVPDVRIARELGVGRAQVARWRKRFVEGGLSAILLDRPRSGRPPKVDAGCILQNLRGEAVSGRALTVRDVAGLCGVSEASVARVRRSYGLSRSRVRASWGPSNAHDGDRPALVGLFVAARRRVLAFESQGVAADPTPAGRRIPACEAESSNARGQRRIITGDIDGHGLAYLNFLERVAGACTRDRGAVLVCESDAALGTPTLHRWRERNPQIRFEIAPSLLEWRRRIEHLLASAHDVRPNSEVQEGLPEIVSTLLAYFTVARCQPIPFVWVRRRQPFAASEARRFCSSAGTGRDRRAA